MKFRQSSLLILLSLYLAGSVFACSGNNDRPADGGPIDGQDNAALCSARVIEPEVWISLRDFDEVEHPDARVRAYVVRPSAEDCRVPSILIFTPYGIDGAVDSWFGAESEKQILFRSRDYAFVIADWRGTGDSEAAAYEGSPSQGQDGADIVAWITSQSWSDGQVGSYGASALGGAQYEIALEQAPGLICAVPMMKEMGWFYPVYYPGGVLREEYLWLLEMVFPGLVELVKQHPVRDAFWDFAEQVHDPQGIKIPLLLIGGWWDHNDLFRSFQWLRTQGHESARDQHRLLFGPWHHFATGTATVGATAELTEAEKAFWDGEKISQQSALAFFDFHLRSIDNKFNQQARLRFFQHGEENWQEADTWPPAGVQDTPFYLLPDQSLSASPPQESNKMTFPYDPKDPSPTWGGSTMWPFDTPIDLFHGPIDQSPVLIDRQDALLFKGPILTEALVVQGYAHAKLHVATDRKDSDFVIRLVDVLPDGSLRLVVDGARSLRFHDAYETESVIIAEQEYSLDLPMTMPLAHTFLAGHRVGLILTSSNWPMFSRNPNNGERSCTSSCADFSQACLQQCLNGVPALNTLFMSQDAPSALFLPVKS